MIFETRIWGETRDKILPTIEPKMEYRKRPIVMYAILIFHIFMFFFAAVDPSLYEQLKMSFGLIPSRIMSGQNLHALVTFIFLPPSVSDGVNFPSYIILYFTILLIFGRGSESMFGGPVFLIFYLFCGIMGGLFHSAITVASASVLADVPMLGASGAIFGIMASFGVYYPRRDFVIPEWFQHPFRWERWRYSETRVPVVIVVVLMIILELIVTAFLFPRGVFFPIGNTTNTGGFLGGVIFSLLFRISGRGPWKKGVRPEIEYELAEPQQ